jgi:hypothetical protein
LANAADLGTPIDHQARHECESLGEPVMRHYIVILLLWIVGSVAAEGIWLLLLAWGILLLF